MFDYKQTAKDIKNTRSLAGSWFDFDARNWTALPEGAGFTYQCEMPHCLSGGARRARYILIEAPAAGHRYPATLCEECAEFMGLTKPLAWSPIIDAKHVGRAQCEHNWFTLVGESAYAYGNKPGHPYMQNNPAPNVQRHGGVWQRQPGKIDDIFNQPVIVGPRILCDQHHGLYVHTLSNTPTMWPAEVTEATARMEKLMEALRA